MAQLPPERPMLPYDPVQWLMAQEGMAAVRARRMLGLKREGDAAAARALEGRLGKAQSLDGSFEHSPMKTAGVLNVLDDLKADRSAKVIKDGAVYLAGVLESQPGYDRARTVRPGRLRTACDLCGFFGPYEDRGWRDVLAHGAREINYYREYEPLFGPKSPVRGRRRSSLDRASPSSCYLWGLIPLSYTLEALCHAGRGRDPRVRPAVNALLGAQRESGGWCRNLGGHPNCTIHAVRALGAHPTLRRSNHAARALAFLRRTQRAGQGQLVRWRGTYLFAAMQAVAAFDLPIAREILRDALAAVAPKQRKNGTFGSPCRVERVAAVLLAARASGSAKP